MGMVQGQNELKPDLNILQILYYRQIFLCSLTCFKVYKCSRKRQNMEFVHRNLPVNFVRL